MTPAKYGAALDKIGITIIGARVLFGVSKRQAQRFASGESPVPSLVEKVLKLLLDGKLKKEDLQ